MGRDYLSNRDKLICELYMQGVGVSEIKERSGIANIYYTLSIYEIPLRTDIRQQLKDNVSEEFDRTHSVEKIMQKFDIKLATVINILKETREEEITKYVEARKRREELQRQYLKKKREAELNLLKIEQERRRVISNKLRIEAEYEEKRRAEELREKKENIKIGNMGHLKGILSRQEDSIKERKELLDEKHPERDGVHSPLERVIEGKESPVIKQIRDRDIAYDYVKGMNTSELASKHNVDLKYVAELLETAGEKPKYYPDRPPLDV